MAQVQAIVQPSLLGRIQAYVDKRSVASFYGPCVFFIFTLTYFYASITLSRRSEFWMDEALAASTAQLPSSRAIINAIWHGAELEPPTYYLFLHNILTFTELIPIQLAARLPSILAGFGAGVVIFVIMRRRVGVVISLLSFGIVLSMGLFPFANQVRGYAFLTFFLALALLFWDGMEDSKHPALSGAGIFVVLTLCLSFHFYGIVEVATIAICEALWILTRKQLRSTVIVPLICLILVESAWIPLARQLSTFNSSDVYSPNFYAKPTTANLFHSIEAVMFGGDFGIALILIGGLLIFAIYYAHRLIGDSQVPNFTGTSRPTGLLSRLEIMMIASASIPILTFIIAVVVTNAYSERYASGMAVFAPMAAGCLLGRLRDGRTVAVLLTPLLLSDLVHKTRAGTGPYSGILPTLKQYTHDSALPIVVDDGVFYIQVAYAADADMRARMVLLTVPDQPPQDPTNQNQTVRTAQFVDYFHVAKLDEFLRTHPRFYVLSEMQTRAITIIPPLMEACALGPLIAEINGKFLYYAGLSYAEQNCGKP